MFNPIDAVVIVSALACVVVAVIFFYKRGSGSAGKNDERIERIVREEIGRNREEHATSARNSREELSNTLGTFHAAVSSRIGEIATMQTSQLEAFSRQLGGFTESNQQKLEGMREAVESKLARMNADSQDALAKTREENAKSLTAFSTSNEQKLEQMRQTVETKLSALQQDNSAKLEQMRATVDEKLHATLEQRLGESFKLVSERLDQVHQGLGAMQQLASDVGGLQRVLTNVKTRGCWGEVQLGNLLEQMLTPDQYGKNVAMKATSGERVEYAVKLPGRDTVDKPVWLPIDAKFPQEEYQRMVDAEERGDLEAAAAASAALETGVRLEAKKICEKYINPPDTTDFAIMFLPTEGLFAEVLRRPGLCDGILHKHRVVLSGPTTLAALLSSLQMGFRTLAIEKRSSEVWKTLGAVKTEFGKFGSALEKVQKKVHEASTSIDSAAQRSRVLERSLRAADSLPEEEAAHVLGNAEALFPALEPKDESA